jgi:hypothetical protein
MGQFYDSALQCPGANKRGTEPGRLGIVRAGKCRSVFWAGRSDSAQPLTRDTSASRSGPRVASTAMSRSRFSSGPPDLTLLFEFGHPVGTVHTDGTEHPDGHIDFWLGDSRGHWKATPWWWTALRSRTLRYTKPWTLEVLLYRRLEPNVRIIENYCATTDSMSTIPFHPRNDRGDSEKPSRRTRRARSAATMKLLPQRMGARVFAPRQNKMSLELDIEYDSRLNNPVFRS